MKQTLDQERHREVAKMALVTIGQGLLQHEELNAILGSSDENKITHAAKIFWEYVLSQPNLVSLTFFDNDSLRIVLQPVFASNTIDDDQQEQFFTHLETIKKSERTSSQQSEEDTQEDLQAIRDNS